MGADHSPDPRPGPEAPPARPRSGRPRLYHDCEQQRDRRQGLPGDLKNSCLPLRGRWPRRAGRREPYHYPKYFGFPRGSLPYRLRAEPPRRGGQGPPREGRGPGMPGPYEAATPLSGNCGKPDPHQSALRTASPCAGEAFASHPSSFGRVLFLCIQL